MSQGVSKNVPVMLLGTRFKARNCIGEPCPQEPSRGNFLNTCRSSGLQLPFAIWRQLIFFSHFGFRFEAITEGWISQQDLTTKMAPAIKLEPKKPKVEP
jgi:hypothetical protein